MNILNQLWNKLAKNKRYREEFVAAQVKKIIPLQIRKLLKKQGISQEVLAERAGLTQGVVSRAANPEYGNLTLNTVIRIAAGFDVAFVARFVPFSELEHWISGLSEDQLVPESFTAEDAGVQESARDKIAQLHLNASGEIRGSQGSLRIPPVSETMHVRERRCYYRSNARKESTKGIYGRKVKQPKDRESHLGIVVAKSDTGIASGGKSTAPPLQLKRGEDFESLYANNVRFESSVWDLKLLFGQLDQFDQSAGSELVEIHTAMSIPWATAKLMAFYLQLNIMIYEMENGKIRVNPRVYPSEAPPLAPDLEKNELARKARETAIKMRADFIRDQQT